MNSLFAKFSRGAGRAVNSASVPDGLQIYAIGDIHGRLDLLDALLEAIASDACENAEKQLVFLGDYVDRGPDSRGVINRLEQLTAGPRPPVCLMGNHEAALLDFLSAAAPNDEWLHWGGAETLASYGIGRVWERPPIDLAREFALRLPPRHRTFLEGLPMLYEAGDYLFVHAGVRPGVELTRQDQKDLLWIRGDFHNAPPNQRPDKVVVHGHHPVRNPLDAGWRIAVDTGAVWSGKLTCVVLKSAERRFLSVSV